MGKRRKRKKLFSIGVFALAVFSGGSPSVQAAVTVSFNAGAPSENVLAGFIPSGATSALTWKGDGTPRDVGQSFLTPSAATMDSFSIQAGGNIQPKASEQPFTLTVYESATISDRGSAISTQSGEYLDDSENPIVGGWVTFDMDNVKLTAGKYYTVMLSWDNKNIPNQLQSFKTQKGDGYADGLVWRVDKGGYQTSWPTIELGFSVQQAASTLSP